jgi:ankyrin repeat protein
MVNGRTSLIYACINNNMELVKLLVQFKADVNKRGNNRGSALIHASRNGNIRIVKYLLNNGAVVNQTIGEDGYNALMQACKYYNNIYPKTLDVIRHLLDQGIDINYHDKQGQTALMNSCYSGYYLAVKYLIDQGVDINYQDKSGETAIFKVFSYSQYRRTSIRSGHIKTIRILIDNGIDINIKNNEGYTVLDLLKEYIKDYSLGSELLISLLMKN